MSSNKNTNATDFPPGPYAHGDPDPAGGPEAKAPGGEAKVKARSGEEGGAAAKGEQEWPPGPYVKGDPGPGDEPEATKPRDPGAGGGP